MVCVTSGLLYAQTATHHLSQSVSKKGGGRLAKHLAKTKTSPKTSQKKLTASGKERKPHRWRPGASLCSLLLYNSDCWLCMLASQS